MAIEGFKSGENKSERNEQIVEWLKGQGFDVDLNNPESIVNAYNELVDEQTRQGEGALDAAPLGLEALVDELQSQSVEAAPLPLEAMASYLSEKTHQPVSASDTALMAVLYTKLKSEVSGASGVFDTHPETDPLYDLPIALADAFEKLVEEEGSYGIAA